MQKVTLSDGFVQTTCKDSHSDADCRLPCRYCAKASNHCVLPDSVRTSEFHKNCHHAYAQAELTRPFPLGHCPKLQPAVPDLAGKDLSASRSTLREELYGQRDTSASKLDGTVLIVTSTRPLPTLDERLFKVVASKTLLPEKFADEMGFVLYEKNRTEKSNIDSFGPYFIEQYILMEALRVRVRSSECARCDSL